MLYEHRLTTQRMGPVKLVTKEELEELRGFRSVYAFYEDAIKHIEDTNTTAGLAGFELYSDTLLVDFDNQPEAAEEFEFYLKAMIPANSGMIVLDPPTNFAYEKYDSGGRSIHFHVPIEPMHGTNIPESQKEFMKKIAPLADMSVYKTSGMFRLNGTFHHKHRGKFKHLLYKVEGYLLRIPTIKPQVFRLPSVNNIIPQDTDLEYVLMRLLTTKVVEGTIGRNNHIFKIAALCKDLGMVPDECMKLIMNWNLEYCTPPLQITGINSTINSAYRKTA